jgi:Fe-Mn family superoxide dismutase
MKNVLNESPDRREFLKTSGKAGLAVGLSATILPALAKAYHKKGHDAFADAIPFHQTPLAYDYKALEPSIDTQTMEIHYTKHAAAYAKNLVEACGAEHVDTASAKLEDVLAGISKYSVKMRNNAGGHYNHELFWKSMTPTSTGKPSGKLAAAIEKEFTSFDAFKTKLSDAAKARFGSGFAWLVLNADKKLVIGSTPNQDNPLMDVSDLKGYPVLGLDVWEHAYYLKYHNLRADYITAWFNVVNWDYIGQRYESMA